MFAVQKKSFRSKFRLAKPCPGLVCVDTRITFKQGYAHLIEFGTSYVPELYIGQILQHNVLKGTRFRNVCRSRGEKSWTIKQLNFESSRACRFAIKEAAHIQSAIFLQNINRFRKHIFDEVRVHKSQRDIAINATKC